MKKTDIVIYCDAKGVEHEALVFAVNPFDNTRLSLVYVDESKAEADNVVKLIDVRHMDSISESNPDLPTYHLNCWKEEYRLSSALPSDHPAFDHPHLPTTDKDGNRIEKSRPEYEAHIEAHQASTQADGYAPSSEGEPEPPEPPKRPTIAELEAILNDPNPPEVIVNPDGSVSALPEPSAADKALTIETKHYSDGSSATGPAPLPDQSPEQQKAAEATAADTQKESLLHKIGEHIKHDAEVVGEAAAEIAASGLGAFQDE